MQLPNVCNVLEDTSKNIRYEVIAYRNLERNELITAVRVGVSLMKRKPKKNSVCRLVTVIGARD